MSSVSGQAIYQRRVRGGACVRRRSHGPAAPGRRACFRCLEEATALDRARYRTAESTTALGMIRIEYCGAYLEPAAPENFSRCAPLKHDRGACAPRRKAKR